MTEAERQIKRTEYVTTHAEVLRVAGFGKFLIQRLENQFDAAFPPTTPQPVRCWRVPYYYPKGRSLIVEEAGASSRPPKAYPDAIRGTFVPDAR